LSKNIIQKLKTKKCFKRTYSKTMISEITIFFLVKISNILKIKLKKSVFLKSSE
jgi:hypothetical protein